MMGFMTRVHLTWNRLLREERGDQNISNLGLIVVSVAIIGILLTGMKQFFPEVLEAVFAKIKGALEV